MQAKTEQLSCPDAVRAFIGETLCSRDNLEVGCFTLSETPLTRGQQVCGVYFCLHGPRLLRLTAIWETETNTIRFYGSQGERFQTTRIALNASPQACAA